MSRLNLPKLFSPIASKLEAVEKELQKLVQSEIPVVQRLAEHLSKGEGKRLRPALLLLVSRHCDYSSKENDDIRFAAIFEMIHTATLIHDDIIDRSSTRRGHPSLNAKWGNTLSVLFGDFLSLQSIRSAIATRNWQMIENITDVATRLIEGELIQKECVYSLSVSRKTYFEIIERKTAILFAACAESGAILAGKDNSICQGFYNFGLQLGRAFQLVDDILDYISTSDQLGKPVFSDLCEGKLTLPLIALLEKAPKEVTPVIERIWASDSPAILPQDTQVLMELMKQHGALDEARQLAKQASENAIDSLPIPNGNKEIIKLLQKIPKFLLERTY